MKAEAGTILSGDSGLDPLTCRMVDDLIVQTRDRFNVTSVVISHDMTGALQIADHIYMLAEGRLVVDGTPDDLIAGHSDLVQQFIDASGVSTEKLRNGNGNGSDSTSGVRYR